MGCPQRQVQEVLGGKVLQKLVVQEVVLLGVVLPEMVVQVRVRRLCQIEAALRQEQVHYNCRARLHGLDDFAAKCLLYRSDLLHGHHGVY